MYILGCLHVFSFVLSLFGVKPFLRFIQGSVCLFFNKTLTCIFISYASKGKSWQILGNFTTNKKKEAKID